MALSDVKYTVSIYTSEEESGDTVSGNSLPGVVSLLIKPTPGWTIAAEDFVLGTPLAPEVNAASFSDSIGPYEIGNQVTCKVIFNDWTMPAADKKITVDIDTINGPKPIPDDDTDEPAAYDLTFYLVHKLEEIPDIDSGSVAFTPATDVSSDAITTSIGGLEQNAFKIVAADLTPGETYRLGSVRIRTTVGTTEFLEAPTLTTNPYGSNLPLDDSFFWLEINRRTNPDGNLTSFTYDLFYIPIQDITVEDQAALLIQGALSEIRELGNVISGIDTGKSSNISPQGETRDIVIRGKQGATFTIDVYENSAPSNKLWPGGVRTGTITGDSKFTDRTGEKVYRAEFPAGNTNWDVEVIETGSTTLGPGLTNKTALTQYPDTTVRFSQTNTSGWTVTGGADIDVIGRPLTDIVTGGTQAVTTRNVTIAYTVTDGVGITLDRQPVFDNNGGSSDWSNSDFNTNGVLTGEGTLVVMRAVRATTISPTEIFVEAEATVTRFGSTAAGTIELELDLDAFMT